MSLDASGQATDIFASRSRDVTPASVRHAARVLYVSASSLPEVSSLSASVLSETELQRADRYAADEDQRLFTYRRAFRRFCGATALSFSRPLSEIDFDETENGRPFLEDAPSLWFSFSASRIGILGAWSSTHGIGVDIEDPSKELEAEDIARQFFSAAEARALEDADDSARLEIFYRFWTLKEAALKSIGQGLPFGLDAFEFELGPNPRVVQAPPDHGGTAGFTAYAIEGTKGSAALVIRKLP